MKLKNKNSDALQKNSIFSCITALPKLYESQWWNSHRHQESLNKLVETCEENSANLSSVQSVLEEYYDARCADSFSQEKFSGGLSGKDIVEKLNENSGKYHSLRMVGLILNKIYESKSNSELKEDEKNRAMVLKSLQNERDYFKLK